MGEHSMEPVPTRNRKRILDPSENNEEEGSARRPNLFSEWQETLKSMGVPSKKGFVGNESQYNDMIDQGLADNFEDSLSGLGVDITTASYNMSEAMMALPPVSLFKQDAVSPTIKTSAASNSPTAYDESSQSNTTDRFFKLLGSDSYGESLPAPSIHQLLQHHLAYNENISNEGCNEQESNEHPSEDCILISSAPESLCENSPSHQLGYENNKFQYILGAATSVAVKVSEESLTYLNQGQSYEIKIKKLGDITRCQGHLFHTKIKICFHERRLQYMEKEQIASWKQMRPGERIVEIDVPLSYGITDVIQDQKSLNFCEFDWEPTKEVGVYIKVNCISTEFTPKKHGGEKGVPFRLQVETYTQTDSGFDILHACACQIKVFKLKGADRKHKQDREKIMKRSSYEINKYQRQCECTILQEIALETVQNSSEDDQPSMSQSTRSVKHSSSLPEPLTTPVNSSRCLKMEESETQRDAAFNSMYCGKPLETSSTAEETHLWLLGNRFSNVTSTFSNFCGMDLLRLSRSELIEICGLVDGIRLFNALHSKNVIPRLTLYICLELDQPYNAVYLDKVTWSEFVEKVAGLKNISPERVHDVYLQGPSNINVLVTDEVIRNFRDETVFFVDILQDMAGEKFRLLLRITHPLKSTAKSNGC